MAALVGHYVEIQVGIAVVTTRLYFWVFAAIIVVSDHFPVAAESNPRNVLAGTSEARHPEVPREPSDSRYLDAVLAGLATSILIVALGFAFVGNQTDQIRIVDIILHAFTAMQVGGMIVSAWGILWMFLSVLILGGFLFLCGSETVSAFSKQRARGHTSAGKSAGGKKTHGSLSRAGRGRGDSYVPKVVLLYAGLVLCITLLYAAIHAGLLPPGLNEVVATTALASRQGGVLVFFYVSVLCLVIAVGVVLYWRERRQSPFHLENGVATLLFAPVVLLAIVVAWQTNLKPIRADMVFRRGSRYEERGQWQPAAEVYAQVVKLAPKADYYHFRLGRAYYELGRAATQVPQRTRLLEESGKTLERARELSPYNVNHTANLARLYDTWAGLESNSEANAALFDRAVAYYTQALSLSPNSAKYMTQWGTLYLVSGRFAEAEQRLQASLDLDDEYDETYFALAYLYYSTSRFEESAAAYTEGLLINPQDYEARKNLGGIYIKLGRHEEAIPVLVALAEANPDDFQTLSDLALLHRDTQRLEEAVVYAQRAARLRPDHAGIQELLGQLQRSLRSYPEAEAAFRVALALNPQAINSLWGLVHVYWEQGRSAEIIAEYESTMASFPQNTNLQHVLADLYFSLSQWSKAIAAYETVLMARPEQIRVRAALARAYANVGRLQEAVVQSLVYVKAVPDDMDARKRLAGYYRDLGRLSDALGVVEAALHIAADEHRDDLRQLRSQLLSLR